MNKILATGSSEKVLLTGTFLSMSVVHKQVGSLRAFVMRALDKTRDHEQTTWEHYHERCV